MEIEQNDTGFPLPSLTCLSSYNSSFNHTKFDTCSESSHMEAEAYPPFKKPKISATPPSPEAGMQLMLHQATTCNFKTQLCRRFRLGFCAHGSKCNFAHGVAELRGQGIVTKVQTLGGGESRMFQEPKLCRMFNQHKRCTYGDNCRFLHQGSREGTMTERIAIGPAGHRQLEPKRVFNASFDAPKRVMMDAKLCINWEINRHCPFEKICRFSRGQAGLGKLDGYSCSEYRVMQTSAAAATNASTSTMATSPLHKKESYGVKCIFKKNELQKISRIYADWI